MCVCVCGEGGEGGGGGGGKRLFIHGSPTAMTKPLFILKLVGPIK